MDDELKPIKGYEGLYSIDRNGNVFSHKRKRYLSLKAENSRGYIQVGLYKGEKVKMFCVHKLVAMTYIPNPNNLPVVDHLDGNKKNNHISNLEWCTQKENVMRALANGLREKSAEERKSAWLAKQGVK